MLIYMITDLGLLTFFNSNKVQQHDGVAEKRFSSCA